MAAFPNSPGVCPLDIEETAEAFAMNRLSTGDTLQFAIHCLTCRQCAEAAEEAKLLARAMKGAARLLRAEPSAMDWEWSQGSLARSTPVPLVGAGTQMRFYVTGYEPPRR